MSYITSSSIFVISKSINNNSTTTNTITFISHAFVVDSIKFTTSLLDTSINIVVWHINRFRLCNNIFKFDIQKHVVRDGKYSFEVKETLHKAADWLEEKTKNHLITIIPFLQYQTSKAIKEIKKYAALGVSYFVLDTFKMDAGKVTASAWMEMQQAMVEINDVIKPEVNNLHILITFQLAKGSVKQRFYTQDNIGMAKNIIDPASTCLMIRDLYEDEYSGERRALQVFRLDTTKRTQKIPVTLAKDKHYQIIFIIKNREGAANQYQIVVEHDMSRNIMKEIGICNVPVDF
jgi:replicative DNA helicase